MKIYDKLICTPTPEGHGVLQIDTGQKGLWFGVLMQDGSVYGWWRSREAATQHAQEEWSKEKEK